MLPAWSPSDLLYKDRIVCLVWTSTPWRNPMRLALLATLLFCQAALAQSPQIADGPFQGDLESLQAVPVPGMVPRRQVRHLGALGPAGRADGGRLVRQAHVRPGPPPVRASPGHLRASVRARLQGHHSVVEGREVGPGPPDGALQEGRCPLLRQHGLAPRQLLPLELEAAPVERREHGAAARRGGRLAEGGAEARPAVRRLRTSRRQLHLVPAQPRCGQGRAEGRRALRRRRPAVPGPVSLPRRAGRHGLVQQQSHAGSSNGSSGSRSWSTTTSPTCSTPTAACRSATKSASA